MKISPVLVALTAVPTFAFAAPKPTSKSGLTNRAKATTFLDGIAASYRKLNSLSATWHRTGNDPSDGTFAWRRSKPPQVRFENKTQYLLFVSDGIRNHLTIDSEITGVNMGINRFWHRLENNSAGAVEQITCDEMTPYFIGGQNPLRAQRFTFNTSNCPARLLGTATVKGVRCRGVEIKELIEGRDSSFTNVFTLWFDSRGLIRRSQQGGDSGGLFIVDFDMRPNLKLSSSLFVVPNRPDGEY